jgi:AraC-like DNA-binding protein
MESEILVPGRRGPRIVHADLFRRLCVARDQLAAGADLPLAGAARAAGLSRFHFLRLFQQAFGETPHEFRTRLRLDRARMLLEYRRDLTVTDVCLEVGFQSLGSFSALFARHVGEPPSRYRSRRVVVVPAQIAFHRVPYCFLVRFGATPLPQF